MSGIILYSNRKGYVALGVFYFDDNGVYWTEEGHQSFDDSPSVKKCSLLFIFFFTWIL